MGGWWANRMIDPGSMPQWRGRRNAHLVVGHGGPSVVGQLYQGAEVGAQVRLASHQQHLGAGAELLDLCLPLWTRKGEGGEGLGQPHTVTISWVTGCWAWVRFPAVACSCP